MKQKIRIPSRRLNRIWSAIALGLAVTAFRSDLNFSTASYIVIQLVTAALFAVRREPLARSDSKVSWAVCGISMLYVYLYRLEQSSPSLFGDTLLVVGSILCLLGTLSLGDCFGVIPAYRGVRSGGMYRVIRHPIYASYIVMDIGIILLCPSLWNVLLFFVAVGLFIWRIEYEESILSKFDSYRVYKSAVPYRLIPLVF